MKFHDPQSLRHNAQTLRRQELARIGRAAGIEWTTQVRRIRALLFPTDPCPVPAPNHRPA